MLLKEDVAHCNPNNMTLQQAIQNYGQAQFNLGIATLELEKQFEVIKTSTEEKTVAQEEPTKNSPDSLKPLT
jgi:hypothetical protein